MPSGATRRTFAVIEGGVRVRVPLFMDEHRAVAGLTADRVTEAHLRDLAAQDRFGVRFRERWFDEATGTLFCLAEAPTREATQAVHRAAQGMVADRIVEVRPVLS